MIKTEKKFGRYSILLPGEVSTIEKSKVKSQKSKVAVLIFSAFFLSGCFHKGKPEQVGKPSANNGEGIEIENRVSKFSKQFGVTVPENVKKAALEPVDGSASSGLATREEGQGEQTITVLANLPDLATGEMYTVQLIDDKKPIALGTLAVAKGGWMIERKVNVDPSIYKRVEVLKGEQILLRGSF